MDNYSEKNRLPFKLGKFFPKEDCSAASSFYNYKIKNPASTLRSFHGEIPASIVELINICFDSAHSNHLNSYLRYAFLTYRTGCFEQETKPIVRVKGFKNNPAQDINPDFCYMWTIGAEVRFYKQCWDTFECNGKEHSFLSSIERQRVESYTEKAADNELYLFNSYQVLDMKFKKNVPYAVFELRFSESQD